MQKPQSEHQSVQGRRGGRSLTTGLRRRHSPLWMAWRPATGVAKHDATTDAAHQYRSTIADVLKEFDVWLVTMRGAKEQTVRTYRPSLQRLRAYCEAQGSTTVDGIEEHLAGWMAAETWRRKPDGTPVAPSTVALAKDAFLSFAQCLVLEGWLSVDLRVRMTPGFRSRTLRHIYATRPSKRRCGTWIVEGVPQPNSHGAPGVNRVLGSLHYFR